VSSSQGGVVWQPGTGGRTGGFAFDVRDNGNLALYSGGQGRLWTHPLSTGPAPGSWPGASGPREAARQYGYPYRNPPACTDGGACVADKWYFYRGQCTSWVAYRLNQLNGFAFSNYYGGKGRWGNADNWGPQARRLGITVSKTPAAGSIAWYSSGHVAYVEQVNSATSVVISEMNYDGDNGFRVQAITPNGGYWPTGFIHVHDR
jgi:surface antigen